MTEPEYSEELDLLVEEIIAQYVAGEFQGEDLERVRNYFFKSDRRKEQLRFAIALKERKAEAPINERSIPVVTQLPPPPRKQSWTSYLAIAAIFVVALGMGFTIWRAINSRSDLERGLVAFNAAFREERPIEARLSNLNYAPLPNQRSGGTPKVDYVQQEIAARYLAKAVADSPSSASHNALGQYYLAEKQFDKAIDQFNKALALDPNDPKSHLDLGAALIERGKLDQGGKGVEDFSRSVEHLNKGLQLDNSSLAGYFNRALAYQHMMLSREAEAAWKEYLQKDASSPWAEEAKSNLEKLEENNERAAQTIDDAFEEFRQARQDGNDDAAWKAISKHYTSAGNGLANRLLDSFLGLSSDGSAEATESLAGLSYLAELENKRTGDRYTSSLVSNYSRAGPEVRIQLASARRHANTAYTLFTQSKFPEAVLEYTAAKEDYEKAGDAVGHTFILYRLAHCYVLLSRLQKAQQSFQELLSICETNSYRWLVIQCLYGLAHASLDSSEYTKAMDYSTQALKKSREYEDQNSIVKTLTELASISNELNRGDAALDYLSHALSLTSEIYVEPMQRWTMFSQIGFSMSAKQLTHAALLFQQQALEIAREMNRPMILARSHGYVGYAYAALKKHPEAMTEVTKGYEIGAGSATQEGNKVMALTSWLIGDIQRDSGYCDKAIEAYDRCIDLFSALDFEYFFYAAHKGKLFCYSKGGDDQATGNELPTVLKLFEEYRATITREGERLSFFAREQSVYDLAIDYEFGRKNNPVKAFEYSEASRARTLLDAVSGSTSVQEMSYGPDLSVSPVRKAMNLGEIQAKMPAAAQILQYAVGEQKLFIWVITKSEIRPEVVSIDDAILAEKVRGYLVNVNQPPRDSNSDPANAARELFQLLIAPVESFLDKNKYLCIIPDKILHYLPFDALVSPKTNNYLIEDYEMGVGTAPSSTVFVDLTNTASRKKVRNGVESFLGVGNPSFDRLVFGSLNDLKSAVKEVRTVSEFYSPQPRLLVGPDATKSAVKSEIAKADVVHLAMHYILSGKSEMLSGFPLTPARSTMDQGADGFWHAAEIYSLDLPRTRLALLSACQTGIEQQYDAEGAVGAARPFLVAGVPVVVASLWAVDSDASAQLMIDLHKHRTSDKRAVTQALRLAKLEMLRGQELRYRHPYYWAPFVVVGGLSTF
jgi:CHAT domain-containing protein/lipopolysaccharide biosynthesis regulator YciM